MTFDEAFDAYILNQKITGWGFQQPTRVTLTNGYDAFPCGYFTEYENGYKMIISGASVGKTAIQEAIILDKDGIAVSRDTEDVRK